MSIINTWPEFGDWEIGNVTIDVDNLFWRVKIDKGFYGDIDLTMATLFTTESVRTRASFENAAKHLGMSVVTITERRTGESWQDFGTTLAAMFDIIVARTEGLLFLRELISGVDGQATVIDAGCGTISHPTQSLIDLYTMCSDRELLRSNKPIAIFGPEGDNRAIASFYELAGRVFEVVPFDIEVARRKGYRAIYTATTNNHYILPEGLEIPIFHPFPRGAVVPVSYDKTPFNFYFEQMRNAVPLRKELLCQL